MHRNKTRVLDTDYQSSGANTHAHVDLRYFPQEHQVNTGVVRQFGMKCRRQMPALFYQHRVALITCQHFRVLRPRAE